MMSRSARPPDSDSQLTVTSYLESPAGSNDPIGFSQCLVDGKQAPSCKWDDVTQAEAYAHTLKAFFDAFPEFAKRDLYLSGESYAGQCASFQSF